MKTTKNQSGTLSFWGFAFFFLAASLDVILKYFGLVGSGVFLLLGFLALFAGYRFVFPTFLSKITERQANVLAILTFFAMTAVVVYMYPLANSGRFGGGSDADDALILAATELVHGRYPFYPSTYLGNAIAPMPGSVILAVPFVSIGLLAIQNVFWLAVFFGVVRNHLKSSVYALALLWLILFFCPAVLQNLVTGTDRMSNAVYILTAMWLMVKTIPNPDAAVWKKLLAAVFLGVALSSRSNFIFVVPLLFSILAQNTNWKTAIKYIVIAGAAGALVTIPFWIYDPAGFTPFSNQAGKITQFEGILPYARIVVPLFGMLLAFGLSYRKMTLDCTVFFWNCAIVQMFSVFLLSTLSSIHEGRLDLYFGHVSYGVFFLFFSAFAGWIALKESHNAWAHSPT